MDRSLHDLDEMAPISGRLIGEDSAGVSGICRLSTGIAGATSADERHGRERGRRASVRKD
jgi:hypothetical protein